MAPPQIAVEWLVPPKTSSADKGGRAGERAVVGVDEWRVGEASDTLLRIAPAARVARLIELAAREEVVRPAAVSEGEEADEGARERSQASR